MFEHSTFGLEQLTGDNSWLRPRNAVGLFLLTGGICVLGLAILQALGFTSPTGCGSPFRTQNIGNFGDPWTNGSCLPASVHHRDVALSLAGTALGILIGSILVTRRMPRRSVGEIMMSMSRAESVREIIRWVGVLVVVVDVLLLVVAGLDTAFNQGGSIVRPV